MKLVLLELENFRQHRKTSLTFREGLTGIIGPNGAGKTTLLEAMAFALFGSRGLRGKVEDVLLRGAPRSEAPRVRLVFEHEGQTFRIEREGGEASLYQGGEDAPLASGSRDVTAMVSGVIRMSYEEFFATYFTEQKGLEFLSGQKGAAERERFIIRMMGYHRFEKAQELLRAERRDRRAELGGREASLGVRKDLEDRLAVEQQKVTQIEQAMAEAAEALRQAESQADLAKRRYLESEAKKVAYLREHGLLRELEARALERERVETELARDRSKLAERLADKRERCGGGTSKNFEALLAEADERVRKSTKERDAARTMLAQEEQRWRTSLAEAEAALKLIHEQRTEMLARIKELERLSGKGGCPTCGQELGSSFSHVCAAERAKLQDIEARFFACRQSAESLRVSPQEVEGARSQFSASEEALQKLTAERQALAEVGSLERDLIELDSKQAAARQETAALKIKIDAQRASVTQVSFSEDIFLKDKGAHEASQSLVSVARLKRVRLEGDLSAAQVLVERTRKDLIDFDGKQREVEQRREALLLLEETDTFLTDFRRHVNSSIRPRLAEIASEFIADLTDGRYTAVEVGMDFAPTVIDDGEAKPIISGGEEDILNLCMRLALSQMLAERAGHSFSLLVLDEVFGSLDEQRRLNVLQLLEKLSHRFEQILIITHLDDVKEGVRHLVYVDYNEAGGEAFVEVVGGYLGSGSENEESYF